MNRELFMQNVSKIEMSTGTKITVNRQWHRGRMTDCATICEDLPFPNEIRPVVAIEDLPESLEEACEMITDAMKVPFTFDVEQMAENIRNPEWLKKNIHCAITNSFHITEFEQQNIMAAPILDTDILVYFYVEVEKGAFIKIRNDMGITWNEAVDASNKNDLETLKIENIFDMCNSLTKTKEVDPPDEIKNAMIVVTNKACNKGAALITIPEVRERIFPLLGDDFRVIPSSVHEVICIPKKDDEDIETLNNMIKETNRLFVEPKDLLSDYLYAYSKKNGLYKVQ